MATQNHKNKFETYMHTWEPTTGKLKNFFRDPNRTVLEFLNFFDVFHDTILNKRFKQKNHIFYLIRIISIVKLKKLLKFEFEVQFLKNIRKIQKFEYGMVELFQQKYGPVTI